MRVMHAPMRRLLSGCFFSLSLVAAGCGSSGAGSNNTPDAGSPGGGSGGAASGGGTGGASVTTIMGNGCAGNTCQNPMCKPLGTAAPIGTSPEIGFELQPSYIPTDTIIPTFDDVPDGMTETSDPTYNVYGPGRYTAQILDFFKQKNMHMDFFINTNNWCGDVLEDDDCITTLTNILTTHNAGNHTVHHIHMGLDLGKDTNGIPQSCGGPDSGVTCDEEIMGVESVVSMLTVGRIPHLTRFRAPYGEPYQAQGTGLQAVQMVVPKYAVEVGWHMDSGDSSCDDTMGKPCFTGMDIYNNVVKLIGTAPGQRWGILLMHGTFPWTKDAVPMLLDPETGYLHTHGFKLATVEDVICWKYGMHSWEIIQQLTSQPRVPN